MFPIQDMLSSKKFWYAVVGVLGLILGRFLDVPADVLTEFSIVDAALIIGQGIADRK